MSDEFDSRFRYHKPDADKAERHAIVREVIHSTAAVFQTGLPDGREKSLSITKLEEAMFWANAALARN